MCRITRLFVIGKAGWVPQCRKKAEPLRLEQRNDVLPCRVEHRNAQLAT